MPRAEKGSAKALANKTKSKGLQKLKWYCQMCQKQCRDQNGFKCHLTSEAHQRQLLLFAENEGSYLRQFSRDFETHFMKILRMTFGTKRVRANDVYQEYIKDKGHIHMNSTVWHTLTGFVQYLESSGKCKIDQNEKGWHVQLIDQEEEIRKQKTLNKAKQEKSDEERMNELLQKQIEKAMEAKNEEIMNAQMEPEELIRDEDAQKITFGLKKPKIEEKPLVAVDLQINSSNFNKDYRDNRDSRDERDRDYKDRKYDYPSSSRSNKPAAPKRSALDQLIDEEERFKEKKNRKDFWLHKDIVVKIVTKKLGSEFYNAKGTVINVKDKYTAEIEVDTGDVIKIDQKYLETVIPKPGKEMLVVNGAYRGETTVLEEILEKKFLVKLRVKSGVRNGRVIEVPYEDASKYAP